MVLIPMKQTLLALHAFTLTVCTFLVVSAQTTWRPPAHAKLNVPGEPTYIQTPGDGLYNHTWYMVDDRNQFVFEVKACSGALVAFGAYRAREEAPVLEIALGAEDNTKMEFRAFGSDGPPLFHTYVQDPLHCNEFRTFWVSWYNEEFRLGRGPIVNEQVLMNWQGPLDDYVNAVALSSEKGHSALWKVSENSGSYQAMYTFGEHRYTTLWKQVEDRHFWTFSLLASSGHAYILLAERLGGTDSNVYEFGMGLGSPNNDRVLIRTEVGGPDETIKAEVRVPNIVVPNGLREYWICWYRGQLELGLGSVYGKNRLLLYKDPVPINVRYLSIATGGQSFGEWLLHDDQESLNYIYTTASNSTDPQELYNTTWVITPREEYFIFAIKACEEASILLSKDLTTYPGESIEIVIGTAGNTKTVIRYLGQTGNIAEITRINLMSCDETRRMWLSWHDNFIRFARGTLFSYDPIIEAQVSGMTWDVGGLGLATRLGNGEWRIQESVGERIVVRTPSVFTDFNHLWRTVTQQNFLTFRVRACSDCHVALSPTLGVDPAESYYDLVIAGYSNRFTLLHEITGIHRVVISAEVPTENLLNCNHHVDLWVGWEGPNITMGRGSLPGYHVLFTHTFDMEHYPVKAVALSTGYGNEGDFVLEEDYSDYFMFYTGIHDHVRWVELTSHLTWTPMEIRACYHVTVYLCAQQNMQNCYELNIGTLNNTKSTITVRGQQVVDIDTPDILSCLDNRNFWVRWTTQRLEIGHGTIPGHRVFMTYQDSNPIPVAYMGFESTDDDYYARWQIDKNAVRSVSFFTPEHFTYEQMWETVTRRNSIVFSVAACSDVHIILSNKVRYWHDVYDLYIGGNSNSRSVIRGASGGQHYVEVDTPQILHCTEQRSFWITWTYGAIEVGRGEIVGKDEFMDYQPLQLYTINAIGYSTGYDNNGTWFIKADPELLPTEPPVTPGLPVTDRPGSGGGSSSLTPDQVAGIVLGVLAALLIAAVIVVYVRTEGSDRPVTGTPSGTDARYFSSGRGRGDTDAIAPGNMAPEQPAIDAADLQNANNDSLDDL